MLGAIDTPLRDPGASSTAPAPDGSCPAARTSRTGYSVVYAALGALASRVEDASSTAAPIGVVIAAGYLTGMAAIQTPESAPTTVLSYLPPTAPIVMPVRLTLTNVPADIARVLGGGRAAQIDG